MRSGYVKSSFLNIADAEKFDKLMLIDLSPSSMCRIFSIQFLPSEVGPYADLTRCEMAVTYGSSDVQIFKQALCSQTWNTSTNSIQSTGGIEIPDGGIMAHGDVYVEATGGPDYVGLSFVSVTYQVGVQGA
jgi:hypothetical protein